MARLHIFISGRVQGVFFRDWTKNKARNLKITGFIKNLADGRVEVVAEGERRTLLKLLALVKQGPRLSQVTGIKFSWQDPAGLYESFEIVR